MRSKSLVHVSLLMLRASAALALTVAPFHLSFDGALPKLAAAVAMADGDDDGSDSDGGDSGGSDGHDGDSGDDDGDHDGGDDDDDDGGGDDHGDSAEDDDGDDSTVAAAIMKLFK